MKLVNLISFFLLMLLFVACLYGVIFCGAWWHAPMALGCAVLAKMIYYNDGEDSVCNLVKDLRGK